nr:immunoglobulin heavy chain junction region [Macaca mulatta]MOY22355.1 immunoglobulin heavy chain junction region [Macaca mulatta]MOY22419.1 immunoglobulin heavy chain junction region [Macaca mulatta]MOY22497.1 immunoglobulin heavy chain junction region [Macaca mulatta]MOY22803.1 immunoglobulin heavy chain junction region [Macaca mulatta]
CARQVFAAISHRGGFDVW